MTTIDPSHRLLAGLRQELTGATRKGTPPTRAQAPGDATAAARERIAAIPRTDPDRPRKAVRIYLEQVLLQEFGAGLAHDAGFPAMVDAVQARMREDAELAQALEQLGALLHSA